MPPSKKPPRDKSRSKEQIKEDAFKKFKKDGADVRRVEIGGTASLRGEDISTVDESNV